MNINEAKDLTNKKLKLYRKQQIGATAIEIAGLTFPVTITYLLSKLGTYFIDNDNLKLAYFVLVAAVSSLAYSKGIIDVEKEKINSKEYIAILKQLKEELEQGQNKFENVDVKDFDLEVEQYKKILTKNKEK